MGAITTKVIKRTRNIDKIIRIVFSGDSYLTRRYYYASRENCGVLEIVRIERAAIGTTWMLDRDNWEVVAIIY